MTTEAPPLKWTPHPVLDLDPQMRPLTEPEVRAWLLRPGGFEAALKYWQLRESRIRESVEDPLRRGFELEFWKDFR